MRGIDVLLKSTLPEDLRESYGDLSAKSIKPLLKELGTRYPERYEEVVDQLKDIGREQAYFSGQTLTLEDMKPVFDRDEVYSRMDEELRVVDTEHKDPKERKKARQAIYGKYADTLTTLTTRAGLKKGNRIYNTVISGARGNPTQLRAMVTTPGVYTDTKGDIIPVFIRRSYGDGIRPIDYLASSFGVRESVISTKRGTADAGFLGKMMIQSNLDQNVTGRNAPEGSGILLDKDDDSLFGRVLARDAAGIPAGTLVTRDVERKIRKSPDIKRVMVHSPIASWVGTGVDAESVGLTYDGQLPGVGFSAGVTAANAVAEPLAQCLDEDTLVRMWDGTTKKIKDVEVGDVVVGSNTQGVIKPSKVLEVFDNGPRDCYRYILSPDHEGGSGELVCTLSHRHLMEEEPGTYIVRVIPVMDPIDSKLITQGDPLYVRDAQFVGKRHVYDLRIDHEDHLYLLANGIITHNSGLNCLKRGTRVRMADMSVKNIEDIKVGDWVLGSDLKANTFPVRVTHTWDQGLQPVQTYRYRPSPLRHHVEVSCTEVHELLQATPEHTLKKLPSSHEFGEVVLSRRQGYTFAQRTDIIDEGRQPCHDITIDHPDMLFVLENGLIVSNSKHTSGAYKGQRHQFSGFESINQFVQAPETFKNEATPSEVLGKVTKVAEAPQGGSYVWVGENRHFVLPGLDVTAKHGDEVEPGDPLSDGLLNPREVVRLRGLGEGRRYWSERLKQLFDDSGIETSKRHTEMLARGALRHVRVSNPDGLGDYLYDDIADYNELEANWKPSPGSQRMPVGKRLQGTYLEEPALHYTIGTKLTPRMLEDLEEAGFEDVTINEEPPAFESTMVRLMEAAGKGQDDWLARTGTSYIGKNLIHSAQRGYDTNTQENVHPYPRLAIGENFGKNVKETGKF